LPAEGHTDAPSGPAATRAGVRAKLTPRSRSAAVNGKEVQLAATPELVGHRTYVPLRFVAESFGAAVSYDAKKHTVTVAQNGKSLVLPVKAMLARKPERKASKSGDIARVYVDKSGGSGRGDVHAVYSDGRDVKLTGGHNCSEAKVASDRHTVGWVEFELIPELEPDRGLPAPYSLVIWRDGKAMRTFGGRNMLAPGSDDHGCVHEWAFYNGASQVVMGRGPADRGTKWFELRSVATGKLLEQCDDPDYYGEGDSIPGWARTLRPR